MADDLGWGELGCYGNSFNETPNLDKLATQGIKFTNAYAAAPVCSPTRAGLITGQYPARVGITDFMGTKTDRALDPAKYVTINEALGQAGYRTGLVGKWHLDTNYNQSIGGPEKHGFHEVIGSETKYIADGDYFFPYDKISTFAAGSKDEYLTDRQSAEAVKFIQRNKANPFFLYLSYYSVHTALEAPEDLVSKYKKKFDAKYGAGEAEKVFGEKNKKHQAKHLDNPYLAAMLERIDVGVGSIMKELEQNGLASNTLVVFYSDNGGAGGVANNGGLRMNKTWLYEGGIREPLIMRLPSQIKAGTKTDLPVTTMDFYPTFLELAKGKPAAGYKLDGISLAPFLTKGEQPTRDTWYWHYPSETGNWKERMSSAVRKGDYKLIQFYATPRVELFNLKADPSEKTNLAEKMPEKVAELQKLLDAWKIEVKAEQPAI
ncbi:N-acetylgalactosamine-6-sulfatase [Rufibacter radiotolerans]|uniref:N-acetylgalactosamine-6-sulfatase n=2 Tax=Rufibacter radiotolerans TaxID=1379910 RepID=A0A0H4VP18_9BACT|nr:N-acetylgalactosamine-6-sulfatase [Rufibacter radiotolerans]